MSNDDRIDEINRHNTFIGELQILVALILFGVSFIGQRYAMLNGMSPITYNACRYVVSTVILAFIKYGLHISARIDDDKQEDVGSKEYNLDLIKYGTTLGIANFGGSVLQQMGLVSVTAGKAGFITGMYVVVVPIAEYFTPGFNANIGWRAWIAAFVSLIGLYLLSGCVAVEKCFGGAIKEGEIQVFIGMLFWVVSIMAADVGAKKVDVITLTLFDFNVTTICTIILALWAEPTEWVYPFVNMRNNWIPIVLVGLSEGLAFAASTLGQMYVPPSRAALLFSLEAVTCAVFSYFLLNEVLTHLEFLGATLMFGAALISSSSSVPLDADEEHAAKVCRFSEDERLLGSKSPEHKDFGSISVV